MSYPTIPLNYDLFLQRWVISADGQFVTAQQQFVRGETPTFAVSFIAGIAGSKAVVNLGTVTAWAFCIKRANLYPTANLVYTTTATATGTGTSSLYSFSPDCSGVELTDAFVILDATIEELADNGQLPTLPADQAARYALTGLVNGYIVRQVDTGTYWIVVDEDELDNSAGWSSQVPMRDYVDSALQIDFTVAGVKDKTRALPCRVTNDYTLTVAPTTSAADAFVRVNATTDVLTSPTAAEFYAANPPTGGGGSSAVGNTVTVDAVFGDDGTGTREGLPFLTIAAAKAAAQSGDNIIVRSGTYTPTTNLAVSGSSIRYTLETGVVISITSNSVNLFSDEGAASNLIIDGYGDIVFSRGVSTSNGFQPFYISHASSVFNVRLRKITFSGGDPTGAGIANVINHVNGTWFADIDEISISATTGAVMGGIYWDKGPHYTNVKRIDSNVGYVIWSICSGTLLSDTNGEMFVNCGSLSGGSTALPTVYTTGNEFSAIWITAQRIIQPSAGSSFDGFDAVLNVGPKLYILGFPKITGVIHSQTGKLYIEAEKQDFLEDSAYAVWLEGGASFITLREMSDVNLTSGAISIQCDGGTHDVSIKRCLRSIAGTSLNISGGTLRIGGVFNTSVDSGNGTFVKNGGTLVLKAGTTLVPHSSQNSIYAGTAQNVISYGHFAKYAKHANVTLLVGSETVSTDIQ